MGLVTAYALSAPAATAQTSSAPTPGSQNPFINKIVFVGQLSISRDDLKKQMRTREPSFFAIFTRPRLRAGVLSRDIAHLEAHYHTNGYFEAKVSLQELEYTKDGRFVDIIIEVREGRPTIVKSIDFTQLTLFDHKDLRKGLLLEPGKPFNASLLDTDVYSIKTKYFNKGYLAVSVTETVTTEDYRVRILYAIEPGTQITIRSIEITGNELSKDHVLEKELAFETGDVCRLGKLLETQRNLFETGLFAEVDIRPVNLDPIDRAVDILVRVRERKASFVEVGFGVGNVLGSRIVAEWGTRNLYGTGRGLSIKSEYAYDLFEEEEIRFKDLQFRNTFYRYDAEFHQRHVLGTKVRAVMNTFLEKDATVEPLVVKRRGATLTGNRRFSPSMDALLGLTVERIQRTGVDVEDTESTSRIASLILEHDKRDFILDPHTGHFRVISVQGAGGILGGDNDFYTISGSYQKYVRLKPGLVLAMRVRAGYADAFGRSRDNGVPVENRFFTGGSNSVRGYDDNSLGPFGFLTEEEGGTGTETAIGGRVLGLTNVELRFPMPFFWRYKISGAVFVDGGNVWAGLGSIKARHFRLYASEGETVQQDYRYSVGLGIRYNTPVGPIRFDYGLAVKQDMMTDEKGRFHISLGQIF